MTAKFMSMKNLEFTLHAKTDSMGEDRLNVLNGHNEKSIRMILEAAFDFAKKELRPIFEEMDRHPPTLSDGSVAVHPGVGKIMKILGKDG